MLMVEHCRKALVVMANLWILVMLCGGVAILSCQYEKDATWSNPLDPNGSNWHPPTVSLRDTMFTNSPTGMIPSKAYSANSSVVEVLWKMNGVAQSSRSLGLPTTGWALGTYTVIAKAVDANGNTGAPDTATVTLLANQAPQLIAASDTVVERDLVRQLWATDADGSAVQFLWGTVAGSWNDSSTSGLLTLAGLPHGVHAVYWAARDDSGAFATGSFKLSVTVGNHSPILTATIGDTALAASKTLSVTVGASDPDGSITKLQWDTASTGYRYTTTKAITLAAPSGGELTVRWRAVDNQGGETADSFTTTFVPAATIDSCPTGVLASDSVATFTWSGSIPEFASEAVTWSLYVGTSATTRTLAYSGAQQTCTKSDLAAGSVSWRLVGRNQFGDSTEATGVGILAAFKNYSAMSIPWNTSVSYGTLFDTRDWQTYRTLKIGGATWMAENLNYRNTTESSDTVGMCYNGNVDSCSKYGRLYTWSEVMGATSTYDNAQLSISLPRQGICPEGWHVPSAAEWAKLTDTTLDYSTAGTQLKSELGWKDSGNGTDIFGFRILPAGIIYSGPGGTSYDGASRNAYFWTASENGATGAMDWRTNSNTAAMYHDGLIKPWKISLRCRQN